MGKLTVDRILNYKKLRDVRDMITQSQINEIDKLSRFYDTNTIKNRLTNIRDFILCGVDDHWLGRLRIIQSKLKNDVLSEYSNKIRYGDMWNQKREVLKDKVKMDKNKFIELYGYDEGIRRWELRNSKVVSYGLEPAIKRYGRVEGLKRWNTTLKQKISTMSERKKIRPYRNGRTLSEYQNRYGVENGFKLWYQRNKRQSFRFSKNYYIDTYGDDYGLKKWEEYCQSMVRTTKQSFIDRYGETKGIKRYEKFVSRLSYTQSLDYYIERYGDEGEDKYRQYVLSKINEFPSKTSKISQKMFWEIYENLENTEMVFFYELNDEYTFYVWESGMTIISVDFKCGNKIIEFDGDYWHSKEHQKCIDVKRDKFLKSKGYDILRISESDYYNNPDGVINKCLKFLGV